MVSEVVIYIGWLPLTLCFFPFSSFSNMTREKGPALSLGQTILGKPVRQCGGTQRMHRETNPGLGKALILHTLITIGKS